MKFSRLTSSPRLTSSLGLLAALTLGACSQNTAPAPTPAPPTPELGSFGLALNDIDENVKPGDDFYRYVSGSWIDSFEIPDEYSSYGSFTVLFERSEERVKTIIEQAAATGGPSNSAAQKIGDYYTAYLNTDAINAAGLKPLTADFAAIDAMASHDDVARMMGSAQHGAKSVIGAYVDVDSKQTNRYIVYLTQTGLGMPNRDYYLQAKFADKQQKYVAYLEQLLTLAEIKDTPEEAKATAKAIYALEKRLAKIHWEPAKRRDRDLTYNFTSVDELIASMPELPWGTFFDASGLGDIPHLVVREQSAIIGTSAIFAETSVDLWKDYFKVHLLSENAEVLPAAFDDAAFAFYGTELRGTPKQRERWKRGVAAVNAALGEAVGQIYVERYFPEDSKVKMDALVANLRTALDQRLDTLPWMSDETKKHAHAKLEKFTPKIGYPDKWQDYSQLVVKKGDAYGNARRANIFAWEDMINQLGEPIDKTEWFMTPQTVNAYYSPNRNEIVFPAAILQAPFFDPHADPAVNYGGIGAVIGHEIGHGFDDQGRKSDGDGVLRDWWTSEDAANFQKLADMLGSQYETYEPVPGFTVNPQLTMGENIGDLGGLSMAYHAYKLSLGGEEAPIIDGLTGDQRFFMSWAQVWKRVVREEQLKNQIAADPHSPARYRVNGVVRNMDAWYGAFGVEPGDALYLAPEQRVTIW